MASDSCVLWGQTLSVQNSSRPGLAFDFATSHLVGTHVASCRLFCLQPGPAWSCVLVSVGSLWPSSHLRQADCFPVTYPVSIHPSVLFEKLHCESPAHTLPLRHSSSLWSILSYIQFMSLLLFLVCLFLHIGFINWTLYSSSSLSGPRGSSAGD